ncbi:MAG: hypothetical protein IKP36_11210 [Bacteroidaceae bacterium]|nr:hypothetical protein [Bacteroidaceae bacterium]
MFTFADSYGSGMGDVLLLDGKLYLLMTNENVNIPRNETHTWLEPGAWRKPCIVHVTMVANSRQALFGKLSHNGSEAVIEKTPSGTCLAAQAESRPVQNAPQDGSVWVDVHVYGQPLPVGLA